MSDTNKFSYNDFPWGPVVQLHEIGEYQIIEYHPEIFINSCGTGKHEQDKTQFHVQGENHSFDSLDEALIGAICLKYDGINTRAPKYISLMLGMNNKINQTLTSTKETDEKL